MAETATMEFTLASPRAFLIRRGFAAPRTALWRAWTQPAAIVRWWGPHGFTTPVAEIDLRPGGRYRIVMRSPDGTEYPVQGAYREIVPPVRLVYTLEADEGPGSPAGEALVTVTFLERSGRTELTKLVEFASQADRDAAIARGVERGWAQCFERLDAALADAADRRAG